jgi:hypothetical protein
MKSDSREKIGAESTAVDGAVAGDCVGGSRSCSTTKLSNARILSVPSYARLRLPPSRKSELFAANNEKP